ncbi:helix-turn-helix transcriptional regulator [Clostridium perfringens]|jgi:transcriptional regulator with XRE-family HTH domain|uniref:helix-turn-helix domain-containing protein n=1 Tax=Clostridium perfringens TaxID=1502 RepID=UPI0013E2A611|nr:helix-turn-helix transcriptional regulator [Clostridium perfringens]MBO3304687.1 helix-turn-helix transcriptional regulator [Clostridium perfringens]MBO3308022.1 helix-turn-helix transcriptional regulator [Clostridium perfringens]MBO3311356.1 helix-turn-helix transcriptional regulator [Clostridium perfringens]MBO3317689.1 helix-turn-helix transcriptional regulator [Clostridium perfringens]MBO3392799.1 helix-turn-helix transcriptional regulator [Clostridium perfringens]
MNYDSSSKLQQILSDNIKFYRKREKISQEKLADLADLDRTFISLIERKKRNISLYTLEKIANALKIDAYLLIKEMIEDE